MILDAEDREFYKQDKLAFFQDFLRLRSPTRDWIPFTPYSYQRPALQANEHFQAWLWPRRAGKTTTVSADGIYNITIEDYSSIICIAPVQNQADRIIQFAKNFILTSEYKDIFLNPKPLHWSTKKIELHNHSSLQAFPEGEGAISALGEGGDIVIIDEVGQLKNARDTIARIQPIILDRLGTLILISTSWGKAGRGRFWFEVCTGDTYKLYECDIDDVMRDQKQTLPEQIYDQKINILKVFRKDMGDLVYNMQFHNSFEGGIDVVFDYDAVLNSCRAVKGFEKKVNLICVDLGKSYSTGDQTIIALCHVSSGTLDVLHWVSYQIAYTQLDKIVENFAKIHGCKNIIVDANTGTAMLEYLTSKELDAQGIFFTNTKKISRWTDKGIKYISVNKNKTVQRTARMFDENKISLPPSSLKILNQFQDFSAIITKEGNISYRHIEGGHDDYVDVVLFAVGTSVTAARDLKVL